MLLTQNNCKVRYRKTDLFLEIRRYSTTKAPVFSDIEFFFVEYVRVASTITHDLILLFEDSAEEKNQQKRVQKVLIEKEWGMSVQAR